jgi:hypothetical protein
MEITGSDVRLRAQQILAARGIRMEVSRAVLARLRAQYPEIAPTRRVGAGLLLWAADTPKHVAAILEREEAERSSSPWGRP